MGSAMLSKSLIQFSVDGQDCVPSLLFDLRLNYGGGNEDNGNLLHTLSAPDLAAGHAKPTSALHKFLHHDKAVVQVISLIFFL